MATTKIVLSGPIFDGEAEEAAEAFLRELVPEVAEVGRDWIKLETLKMDRSHRGGTGRSAEGVRLTGAGTQYVISGGLRKGEYSWPWLEGTSKRNESTGFKGYKTFRRTRLRMRKQAGEYAQRLLAKYLERMGGEAL
jgi:hypothetical protein